MKRTLISLALIAASSAAFAGGVNAITGTPDNTAHQVCDGGASSGKTSVYGGDGASITGTTVFIQQGLTIQCSANVAMSFQENSATIATVAAASLKGNQVYGGSSNGGAISAVYNCTSGSCGTGDIDTGLSNAYSSATSTGN